MIPHKRRLLAVLCVAALSLAGAKQVEVRLHVPPQGQMSVEQLWWVDLNNRTRETFTDVWLHGEVREARRGLVYRANSNKFRLGPGRKSIRLRDIAIHDQWHAKGYQTFVLRTGKIPPGDYTYWVTLEPELGGDTWRVTVRQPSAPRLLGPRDGSNVHSSSPTFSWTPVLNYTGTVRYRLAITLMGSGQTPEQAMTRNRTLFSKGDVAGTQFRYPTSAPGLQLDRRYAWQVTAEFQDRTRSLASAVWSFTRRFPLQQTTQKTRPLEITRTVTRHDNWFLVTLELTNRGSLDICNIVLKDKSHGFQCIDQATGSFVSSGRRMVLSQSVPCSEKYELISRSSSVEIDLSSPGLALGPGRTLKLSYPALPVIHPAVEEISAWRVIGRRARVTYGVVHPSGDTSRLAQSLDEISHTPTMHDINVALAEADYLIATAPGPVFWHTPGDIETKDSLLVLMARLAKAKRGALMYYHQDNPYAFRREILEAGKRLGIVLGVDWPFEGNLLLVGERNIVPHFPPVTFPDVLEDQQLKLNDYPYANWTGNQAPELAVGRVLGMTARDLMIPLQASLELLDPRSGVKFDRSHAILMSGHETGGAKFIRDIHTAALTMRGLWHAATGIDTTLFHTEFLTTRKRVLSTALQIEAKYGGGEVDHQWLAGIEDSMSVDSLAAWLLSCWQTSESPPRSKLDDMYPPTPQDKYFRYQYKRDTLSQIGPLIRFPRDFDATGRATAINRAEWLKVNSPQRRGVFGEYAYLSDDNMWAMRNAIRDTFRSRVLNKDLIVWVGHSHGCVWGDVVYGWVDVQSLNLRSGNTRPVVIGSGCESGVYTYDDNTHTLPRGFLKYGASCYIGAATTMVGGDNDLKWDWWTCWKPQMSVGQGFRALKRHDMMHGPRMSPDDPEYDACESGEFLRLYLYQMNLYGDPKVGG